jgi:hypothetical protein
LGGDGQHIFIGGEDATESMVLGEAFADAILAFAVDVVGMAGGVGTAPTMRTDIVSTPALGAKASLANMGGPLFNSSGQVVLDNLAANLTRALSKVGKTK